MSLEYVKKLLATTPTLAQELTKDKEGNRFPQRTAFLRLRKDVDDFIQTRNPRIVILPGLRGMGKTTLMFQLYQYLIKKNVPQERLFYIRSDEATKLMGAGIYDLIKIFEEEILRTTLESLKNPLFILIDEAHSDPNWATAIKVIYDRCPNAFLFVTGSSALALQTTTDLARRAKIERIFSMSFLEYLIFKHNIFPPRGSAKEIRNALFLSDSAETCHIQLSRLFKDISSKIFLKIPLLEKRIEDYLTKGSFPLFYEMKEELLFPPINSVFERIISDDIPSIHPFEKKTLSMIPRISLFLATKRPGQISQESIKDFTGISKESVIKILDSMVKSEVLLLVKPYAEGKKLARKSWKYYFTAPALKTAVCWTAGLDVYKKEFISWLFEDAAAGILNRVKETTKMITFHYDPRKGCADFILRNSKGKLIPLEVGWGKKNGSQVKESMRAIDSDYGLVVCNIEKPDIKNNIVSVPKELFLLA